MKLILFGLGYSALHFARHYGAGHEILATATTREKAFAMSQAGVETVVFNDMGADAKIAEAIADADAALISIPPDPSGDPVCRTFASALTNSIHPLRIVYLSTIGVYGDHQGAWVDETSPCDPQNDRSQWRLRAEAQWRSFGEATGNAVHLLRLAGIYGPGQNALVNLQNGTARRIVKPGQVFNRIHVEDIARAIAACLGNLQGGVWNVADDEPAPAEDVVTYAAALLGVEPPQLVDFSDAAMSPMARSFYAECKRASNHALKQRLGVRLAYPNYREALDALFAAGEGRG